MTDPYREDWPEWQGQPSGKQRPRKWDSQRTQRGGEGCPGLRGQTSGAPTEAKIAIPTKGIVPSPGYIQQRLRLELLGSGLRCFSIVKRSKERALLR